MMTMMNWISFDSGESCAIRKALYFYPLYPILTRHEIKEVLPSHPINIRIRVRTYRTVLLEL